MYRIAGSNLRSLKRNAGEAGVVGAATRLASTAVAKQSSGGLLSWLTGSSPNKVPALDFPLEGVTLPPPLADSVEPGKTKVTTLPNGVKIASQPSPMMGDGMILRRWFSSNAERKPTEFSTAVKEEVGKMAKTPAKPITSFSPLETVSVKARSSGLGNESVKIKRTELVDKITFALIPALILTSKGSLTTSILVLSVYWQVYGFFKEIFLDYVHQEVTRKWVLIYFQILLLILAKDTILSFGLV